MSERMEALVEEVIKTVMSEHGELNTDTVQLVLESRTLGDVRCIAEFFSVSMEGGMTETMERLAACIIQHQDDKEEAAEKQDADTRREVGNMLFNMLMNGAVMSVSFNAIELKRIGDQIMIHNKSKSILNSFPLNMEGLHTALHELEKLA